MTGEFRTAEERRAAVVAAVRSETGIDEAMIETLVRGFYARVREEPTIGPIFNSHIAEWQPHLEKMCAFWSSLVLHSGRYHGQPMAKHLALPIDSRHFDRWLTLFEKTARDLCPSAAADLFMDRARRVAESLELGIACSNGVLLQKGQRYQRSS